jgi:hypothetical protein
VSLDVGVRLRGDYDRLEGEVLRDLARGLAPALSSLSRPLAADTAHDLAEVLCDSLMSGLTRDLETASGLLEAAASDFRGVDLSEAALEDMSLASLRWDRATTWPSRAWAERMRHVSAEDPPGSGVFVVLPDWDSVGREVRR